MDAEIGCEVLVWTAERGSKTRQGLEGGHQRQFRPKAFATGTNRCPVLYYKLFKARRPQKANSPESPFYLAVNHQTWRQSQVWYKSSPLGKNEIWKFMSTVAKNAGLTAQNKKISNHSVRKMSISRCWCARKFCDPTKWPQKSSKFEFIQISFRHTPAAYVRYVEQRINE